MALPFLESLARPTRTKAWAPEAGKPKRLVIFFNGHGLIMEEMVPREGFVQGQILQPVADPGLPRKTLGSPGVMTAFDGAGLHVGKHQVAGAGMAQRKVDAVMPACLALLENSGI